jgi:hypothetical protein
VCNVIGNPAPCKVRSHSKVMVICSSSDSRHSLCIHTCLQSATDSFVTDRDTSNDNTRLPLVTLASCMGHEQKLHALRNRMLQHVEPSVPAIATMYYSELVIH